MSTQNSLTSDEELCGNICDDYPELSCTYPSGHGPVEYDPQLDAGSTMDHGAPERGAWWTEPREPTLVERLKPYVNNEKIHSLAELESLKLPDRTILTTSVGQTYMLYTDRTASMIDFMEPAKQIVNIADIKFPVSIVGVLYPEGEES